MNFSFAKVYKLDFLSVCKSHSKCKKSPHFQNKSALAGSVLYIQSKNLRPINYPLQLQEKMIANEFLTNDATREQIRVCV